METLNDNQSNPTTEYDMQESTEIKHGGAESPLPETACRTAYSRAEIGDKAREWMHENFGPVKIKDEEDRDAYYLKLGVIYSFLCDHFPE